MFVRKLNENDWKAYKALRLEALRLHPDVYGGSLANALRYSDSEWQNMLSRHDSAFFGLFDDGTLVGSGGVFMKDEATKTGMLIGGYIRESYRNKGYSRMIYEARIKWAKESSLFNKLIVGHRKGNEASRRANQAFDFHYVGEHEEKFGDGTIGIHVEYEMRLS